MTDAYFFTEKKETNHTHGRIQKNRSVYLYAGKQKEFIRMEEFRRTYIEKKKYRNRNSFNRKMSPNQIKILRKPV